MLKRMDGWMDEQASTWYLRLSFKLALCLEHSCIISHHELEYENLC